MFGLFSSPRYTDPQLGEFQRSRGHWRGLISFQGEENIPLVLSGNRKAPDIQALQSAHVRDMGDGCYWTGRLNCVSLSKGWRTQIQAGTMSGSHIHQAAQVHIEDMGEDMIKLQLAPTVNPAVFYAILYAARLVNMPVAGHPPYTASLLDPRTKQRVNIEHDKSLSLAMACHFLWRMVKP